MQRLEPPLPPLSEDSDDPSQVSTEPFSPLPELTVERIDPENNHDEPEDELGGVKFERKIKKLHRHLFFNEHDEEAAELSLCYGLNSQETSSSRADRDHSIREMHSISRSHDSPTLDQNCFKESGSSVIVGNPMIVQQSPDKLDLHSFKDQTDTSSEEENGVQVITCHAQIHQEQSGDEESPVHEANEDGGKRGSIQGLINMNTSERSNDKLQVSQHRNIQRHSMGSMRLTAANGRDSSPLHVNIPLSKSWDPDLEVCDSTESSEYGKVWTDTDSETDSFSSSSSFESEERAGGNATSMPKSTQSERSPTKSPKPKRLSKPHSPPRPKAPKSPSLSKSGTLISDDDEQDISNTAEISKARRSATGLMGRKKKWTSTFREDDSGEKTTSLKKFKKEDNK